MSKQASLYLCGDVQVDPLVTGWYAHHYLLAPATHSQYIVGSHLPMLKSFVRSPESHVAALQNPEMLGGPFLSLSPERRDEVDALRRTTEGDSGHLVELARALRSLYGLLRERADGSSLEVLYESVPEPLKGVVELYYDLNHQPSFRLFERLLCAGRYRSDRHQQVVLRRAAQELRPYVLSTPRLREPGDVWIDLPFASPALDRLFAARHTPISPADLEELASELRLPDQAVPRFKALFTSEVPPPREAPPSSPRVRYLGHACVLLETPTRSVLVDPWIPYDQASEVKRCTHSELPERIDYVLLTHAHVDHTNLETLLQLRHKVGEVVVPRSSGSVEDPSLKVVLEAIGFPRVRELDELETIRFDDCEITGVPFLGEHGDLAIRSKLAYYVRLGEGSVLLVADSKNLDPALYRRLREVLGPIDLLFLGMECKGAPMSWFYGPFFPRPLTRAIDQARRLNGSNAVQGMELVRAMAPKQVVCYALGAEPWLRYIVSIDYTDESLAMCEYRSFEGECAKAGVPAQKLHGRTTLQL